MNIKFIRLTIILIFYITSLAHSSENKISVNQKIWSEFSSEDQVSLLTKFSNIEVIPTENVGTIQSAQVVNRSTSATYNGSVFGSALGQASYIDQAFSGSKSNYSAISHLGAAIFGGAIGSIFDTPGEVKFLISYGIRTSDGQIRQVRVDSVDEIALPTGQCVFLYNLSQAPPSLCVNDKYQFLKYLTTLGDQKNENINLINKTISTNISCRVPNVGLLTLELSMCQKLDGVVEKWFQEKFF